MSVVQNKYTSMRTRKENELTIIFNFFITNNYQIEKRQLELQRLFTGRKDKEL